MLWMSRNLPQTYLSFNLTRYGNDDEKLPDVTA